jgi:23S rRNA (cytosine1962-C5)-methyltransferase
MNPRQLAEHLVPVLYEDEHYLIVDKPAGLTSVSGKRGVADLVSIVPDLMVGREVLLPDEVDEIEWYLIERMDRFASGPVTLAKSEDAAAAIADQLTAPTARNRYVGVVRGTPKQRHLAAPSAGRRRPPGKAARRGTDTRRKADDETLELNLVRSGTDFSMVEFETGNAIEADLRRQLFQMGVPLLGDVRHSRRPDRRQTGRYFLHRARMRVYHPFRRRMLTVSSETPPSFESAVTGRWFVSEHLRTALAARLPCLLDPETDSYRLLCGQMEGVPGLIVERYGPIIVFETQQGKFQGDTDLLLHLGRWYLRHLDADAIYVRSAPRDRSQRSDDTDATIVSRTPLLGKPCDEEIIIRENGLRFAVRPFDGWNVGLFLDQRENRRRVRELAAGKHVLNLFAFTCGFSVAAAAGDAASVTSVDLKKARLEQGKVNFRINGLPLDDHRFICSESFSYFERARRQERTYDLIIIDPPTFARSKKPRRTFAVEKDLRTLIAEALTVLNPGGHMLVSTNYRRITKRWLADQVALAAAARPFTVVGAPPLPVDFAVDRDHAKCVLVRFR